MKKTFKFLVILSLILFSLLNLLIVVHSYSFTHYDNEASPITQASAEIGTSEKLKMLFTGVDLPRPRVKQLPECSYEDIVITVDQDKKLSGWLLRTDTLKKGIILVFHGYVDEKSSMLNESYKILEMGYDVVLIDFMGSNDSYGNQTTIGYLEAENVISTYDYAVETLQEDNIYLFGFSMGAAAVIKAQHDKQLHVSGIILQAPYATFEETVAVRAEILGAPRQPTATLFTFWAGKINGFDAFAANPIDYAKTINVPTLLMCGAKDQYIPEEETQAIYDAIGTSSKTLKLFEESKHESYLLKYAPEWEQTMSTFLNTIEQLHIHANCENYFDEK